MISIASLTHIPVAAVMAAGALAAGAPDWAAFAIPMAFYIGREGAEAQHGTPAPKREDWYLPFTPWLWPASSIFGVACGAAGASLAVVVRLALQ